MALSKLAETQHFDKRDNNYSLEVEFGPTGLHMVGKFRKLRGVMIGYRILKASNNSKSNNSSFFHQ